MERKERGGTGEECPWTAGVLWDGAGSLEGGKTCSGTCLQEPCLSSGTPLPRLWALQEARVLYYYRQLSWWEGVPGDSVVKRPAAKQEAQVQSLGQEDLLEKEGATHSGVPAWKIPWTEELLGCSPCGRKDADLTCWLNSTS